MITQALNGGLTKCHAEARVTHHEHPHRGYSQPDVGCLVALQRVVAHQNAAVVAEVHLPGRTRGG